MEKKIYRYLAYLSISAIALTSCDTSQINPSEVYLGYDYYPLETGIYREYEVNTIIYDKDIADSSTFYLKEIIGDSITNQAGNTSYLLNRYKKYSDTSEYVLDSIWTIYYSNTNLVIKEGNTPFSKMIFPIEEGEQWDKSAYNVLDPVFLQYKDVDQPDVYTALNISETVTVMESFIEDPIVAYDVRFEIYGRGIGLIYKESVILQWCQDNTCMDGISINNGLEYRQTLIDFGKE